MIDSRRALITGVLERETKHLHGVRPWHEQRQLRRDRVAGVLVDAVPLAVPGLVWMPTPGGQRCRRPERAGLIVSNE